MQFCSRETLDALVDRSDIEREPHKYPKGVIDAFKRMDELEAVNTGSSLKPEFMFAIDGFIIQELGPAGIRPDASDLTKKEWMEYWETSKASPNALGL